MSAEEAQQEPTMEEILASIRRIISEDDVPEGAEEVDGPAADVLELTDTPEAPVQPAEPEAFDLTEALSEDASAEDEIDLDDLIVMEDEADVVEFAEESVEVDPKDDIMFEPDAESDLTFGEDDSAIMAEPEPDAVPAEAPVSAPVSAPLDDGLVGAEPATQAAGALGKLMGSMMVSQGATLDGIVRELLKPMLKDWLDDNLPAIVEQKVQEELERIRRMAG